MAQRKLRILLRCMRACNHRVCQQAIFVLVQGQLGKFAGLFGFRASGIVAKSCCGTVSRAGSSHRNVSGLLGDRLGACAHQWPETARGKSEGKKGAKKRFMTNTPPFFQRRRIESSLKL